MDKNIVTRYAPSPTGFMHVGGVRTALFAWLVARQSDGKFILRIEDTDKVREVPGSIDHIKESLQWVGLQWDEGPDIEGPSTPYKQSERLEIYKQWAQKLVDSGRAYADTHTPQELDELRQQAKEQKRPFLFREHRPENPPQWDGTMPLRLKSEPKEYNWHDIVMGDLHAGPETIDDFILMKSDGYPTYNFCHIVDDSLMGVTHVIRSQEFIASVPKFLNLYEALNIEPPQMATLPYVMATDGRKKLGKRDGAKDVLDYAKEGYIPEAMINFLATLGWNDGTEQEIFSRDELIAKFSLERVQRSGAIFDEKRLLWMNGYWIRSLDIDDLANRCEKYWPSEAEQFDPEYRLAVLRLVQERLKFLGELPTLTTFFFADLQPDISLIQNNKQLSSIDKASQRDLLTTIYKALKDINFDEETLNNALNSLLEQTGYKPGVLFSLIRVVTTWANASPELSGSLAVLGKERTLHRINEAINLLS